MHLCYTQDNNMQEAAADGTNDGQARAHFGTSSAVHARERIFSFRARNLRGVGLASTATVHYHLNALRQEGLHQHGRQKNRTISLPDRLPIGKIPVVGVVTAGVPILAVENIEGYLPWDGDEAALPCACAATR